MAETEAGLAGAGKAAEDAAAAVEAVAAAHVPRGAAAQGLRRC